MLRRSGPEVAVDIMATDRHEDSTEDHMPRNSIALSLAMALIACGSSHMETVDVQSFHSTAQAISIAVTAYGSSAAGTSDGTSCASAESSYEAQVGPLMQHMHGLAGAMDARMSSMGHMASADMTCAADAMTAELGRHRGTACGPDLLADKAEAASHVQAMTAWSDHQRIRSEQMGSMMGMATMGPGGTTGTCQHNPDGSFTMQ